MAHVRYASWIWFEGGFGILSSGFFTYDPLMGRAELSLDLIFHNDFDEMSRVLLQVTNSL